MASLKVPSNVPLPEDDAEQLHKAFSGQQGSIQHLKSREKEHKRDRHMERPDNRRLRDTTLT
ncbi:hypothetical protein F2Q70_00008500 [Brassica cretica]|uniref:Uncharacterized protein n=1 Tax=Brassica cretica TaxID=69181 RepID=A0A8S9M1T2_BRACR|nr:hypothetical protein F2Q70_00008500 [Brassica cretica]